MIAQHFTKRAPAAIVGQAGQPSATRAVRRDDADVLPGRLTRRVALTSCGGGGYDASFDRRAKSRAVAKRAVYPGMFDPIHNGHVDVIQREPAPSSTRLIVAVVANPSKEPLFTVEPSAWR